MATATLTPTLLNAAGGWTDEAGGSPVATLIDEASPGADYIRGTISAATTVGYWALSGVNGVPSAVTLNIRHSRGSVEGGDNGGGNDTYTLLARVWNAAHTTALTDELTVETGTVGYLAKTENIAMAGIGGSAADWATPHLALRNTYSRVSGADVDYIWVDLANLTVTYTPTYTGTLGVAGGSDGVAASGTAAPPAVTGTVAEAGASDTLAAEGSHVPPAVEGTLAATTVGDSVAGVGLLEYAGTMLLTAAADILTGEGTVEVVVVDGGLTGTAAITGLEDVLAGVGKIRRPLTRAECCAHHGRVGHVCVTRNPEPLY